MSEVGATGVVLPSAMWVFVSAEGRVHHNYKWPGKTMTSHQDGPNQRKETASKSQYTTKQIRHIWDCVGSNRF